MVEGIQVFGTAGSIDGIELLRGLGVENVFNHSTQNYQDEILVQSYLFSNYLIFYYLILCIFTYITRATWRKYFYAIYMSLFVLYRE